MDETPDLTPSDEEVLILSQKTPSLFRLLIRRYEPAFLRRAQKILGPREEVNDVVVETFSKIYFKAHTFKPTAGGSFRAWGFKILERTAFNYYRRLEREAGRQLSLEALPGADLVGAVEPEPESTAVWLGTLLSRLPAAWRRTMDLVLSGWSYPEIAAAERVSLSAIKMRAARAKKELRRLITLDNYANN